MHFVFECVFYQLYWSYCLVKVHLIQVCVFMFCVGLQGWCLNLQWFGECGDWCDADIVQEFGRSVDICIGSWVALTAGSLHFWFVFEVTSSQKVENLPYWRHFSKGGGAVFDPLHVFVQFLDLSQTWKWKNTLVRYYVNHHFRIF